ncbi:hypothetical protein AMECASPLE_030681 [Ameca splendens]|uniref:Uncharacterized protein n=1 Tax=Ameca splendens TaxID=208324 RepID=A0ABV0Y6L0_9TELE
MSLYYCNVSLLSEMDTDKGQCAILLQTNEPPKHGATAALQKNNQKTVAQLSGGLRQRSSSNSPIRKMPRKSTLVVSVRAFLVSSLGHAHITPLHPIAFFPYDGLSSTTSSTSTSNSNSQHAPKQTGQAELQQLEAGRNREEEGG